MEQPSYRLEVEALELGGNTKAVGLELMVRGMHEPLSGKEGAPIWAAILPALAAGEPWVLDFFAHLNRVRDFCRERNMAFREPNSRTLIIPAPEGPALASLLERFAAERFGARADGPELSGHPELERELADGLAARGIDAYDGAYHSTLFCAVCDFESGFLTVLSDKLWASEVIRRVRPALKDLGVEVNRPE